MDAGRPKCDAFTLENVGDGCAVDAELDGEVLRPAPGPVGVDKLSDFATIETVLGLLWRTIRPHGSSSDRQLEQGSEAFWLVRRVRISSHKLLVPGITAPMLLPDTREIVSIVTRVGLAAADWLGATGQAELAERYRTTLGDLTRRPGAEWWPAVRELRSPLDAALR